MVSAVNVGSINMPKMLRHLSHRSSQVRDLVFARDAIFHKTIKTTGATTSTEGNSGSDKALAGPGVNFGYEDNSYVTQSAGTDKAYHINSPEIVLPGLKMLQSPITSRSGKLERLGHRISGACTFYAPSLDYIKALDNFKDTKAFAELESYDKLYDIERIIQNPSDVSATQQTTNFNFADDSQGYEVDRIQFKIKTSGTLNYVRLSGDVSGSETYLTWAGSGGASVDLALSSSAFTTIDLPVRNIKAADTSLVYKGGTPTTFYATLSNDFDVDKLHGIEDSGGDNELNYLRVHLTGSAAVEIKDVYLYKEAEWRVESIKDYRDEYMQIKAVRVRGDRASRRRSYG